MKNFIYPFICLLMISASIMAQNQAAPTPTATPNDAPKQVEKLKYEVQFSVSTESLSKNFGTWRTASLYFQRKFDNKQIVWANYRLSDRKSTRDQEFIVGIYKPLGKKWAVTSEAMISDTHKFVGKFSVMAEVEKALKKGWVVHGGGRYTAYDKIKATAGYGMVEKYWGNNRGAYTLYLTKLTDAGTAPTHRIQYNRYYGENVNNFGVSLSFGKEHENLGPNLGILRSNTWSISASEKHWFTEKFAVNASVVFHQQGNIYNRKGVNFGLTYRF